MPTVLRVGPLRKFTASGSWLRNTSKACWRTEMSSFKNEIQEALATSVEVNEDTLSVELADGRTIATPLAWYPRLAHATAAERQCWRLIGGGRGIHWPMIDE